MMENTSAARVIAVVDDEPDIVELVSIHLKKARFEVMPFTDASSFMMALNKQAPDLIILDLMLPDADGMDICKHLKSKDTLSSIPIIMLTARSEETDKIIGLELGADDYVTKPFSPRELVARVKAVLRRKTKRGGKKITVGKILHIDPGRYDVTVDGKQVALTSTEFRLLYILAQRIGWVYSRNQLLNALWGEDKTVIDRTIDVHINHLREKLGKAGAFIKNVRGIGYKLEA